MVKSGIHFKLDWFTAMFEECSIMDVLDIVGINLGYDLLEVYSNLYLSSKGYGTDITFNFDGINIKTDLYACYKVFHTDDLDSIDPLDFFNAKFCKIRLDLSGKALDQLRSSGLDVEAYFSTPFEIEFPRSYHVTRCDFAFDLVDYAPTFLDSCINACNSFSTSSGRLFTSTGGGGMKYGLRTGDQRTLYIGSPRSDKLLRIYDKRFQFEQGNRLASDCPYNDGDLVPDSWTRVELQTRNSLAQNLLYIYKDPLEIFKFIFDNFAIRQDRGLDAPICEEWLNLFDWSVIPSIIQNAKSVQYETILERAEKYIYNIALSNIYVVACNHGWDYFQNLRSEFIRLQRSNNPLDRKRFASIFTRMTYSNASGTMPDHLIYDKSSGVYDIL